MNGEVYDYHREELGTDYYTVYGGTLMITDTLGLQDYMFVLVYGIMRTGHGLLPVFSPWNGNTHAKSSCLKRHAFPCLRTFEVFENDWG